MNTETRRPHAVNSALTIVAAVLLGACTGEPPLAPEATRPLNAPMFSQVGGLAHEIIDLGTLGGASSVALAINGAGQVVGWSATAANQQHAFLWQDGVFTDLGTHRGTLGGAAGSALAINDAGQVVGMSQTGGGLASRALLWQDGVMTDLGTLGGASGIARAINDAGQVVGQSNTASQSTHAFLWQDGVFTDLGTLGGVHSVAFAINDAGQVVGQSLTKAGQIHAFLWQDGVMTDLGTLGGSASSARAINDAGQVVGQSSTAAGETHAFLWQDGVMTDLGTLGGTSSSAFAINKAGQVVGSSSTAAGEAHAVLWQDGVMTDLGTLGGSFSVAAGINEIGEIVGAARDAAGRNRAVLWRARSDGTPPGIVASIDGTLGSNGWYTSNVTVSWNVTDDESVISSTTGCDASLVSIDTQGQSFTCKAKSDGGEAAETVTVKRDASPPEIAFSGAKDYTVDQDVAITCNASDPTSRIATQSCPGASGPGYSFSLGTHTLNASATNDAGLGASASTSFTVRVTFTSSSVLTVRFVTHAGNANSLVQKLDAAAAADERGNENSKRAALRAYVNEIEALTGRSVSAEHAAILIRLANAL